MSMPGHNSYPGFPRPVVDCSADLKAGRMAVQADRDEVDINRIVKRMEKGLPPPTLNGEPFFGDVSEFGGLQEAFMKVQESKDLFMQLPADLRDRFDNNPIEMIAFLEDRGNLAEAVSLGLVQKSPADVAAPPASVPPEAPANLKP